MDSKKPVHILYLYFDDISAPKGPSVNEREFLNGLEGSRTHYTAIIPEPAIQVEESKKQNVHTVSPVRASRLHQLVVVQWNVTSAAISLLRQNPKSNYHIVIRLPFLPWSAGILPLIFPNVPMHVKSLGDTDFLNRKGGFKGLVLKPIAFLQSLTVRFVLKRTRTIDTVTEKLAHRIGQTNKIDSTKIYVIPNTTNTSRFYPKPRSDEHSLNANRSQFVIGYIGGHPFLRGGSQIIHAVSHLSDSIPGIRCIIAGGDVRELEEVARKTGVKTQCDIVGKIPYDSVNDFLNDLDVLFATDDGVRAKLFGNSNQKIRQALSVGIPVISNREAELDLIENNLVYAIDTDDMDAVCNAFSLYFNLDPLQRKDFSSRARNFIENKYSLKISTARRLEIWASESEEHTFSPDVGRNA